MLTERWRQVPKFSAYQVSSRARVRRARLAALAYDAAARKAWSRCCCFQNFRSSRLKSQPFFAGIKKRHKIKFR
jgi:hypothetical protein